MNMDGRMEERAYCSTSQAVGLLVREKWVKTSYHQTSESNVYVSFKEP